jgi:hypothetical protein
MDGVTSAIHANGAVRFSHQDVTSPEDLAQYLSTAVRIDPIGSTGSLKITYRHRDPIFAVRLLNIMRKAADQLIKNQDKEIALHRVEWLKSNLKTSINPEHRQALARLLMAEERRIMILSLDEPYAMQVIEEASAGTRHVTPPLLALLFLGPLMGIALAAAIVVWRDSL